jgi:hypothetical protein
VTAPARASTRRWRPWIALAGALLALVVWPLQALAIAMLVTTGLMTISIYSVFAEHRVVPAGVRARLDEGMPFAVGTLVAVGAVAVIAWPTTLTPIAFVLLVLACAAWLASEWLLGHHHARGRHARGGGQTR